MAQFRFRAAAALDLRRRQEQDAEAALRRIEAELHQQQALLEQTRASRSNAQHAELTFAREGTDAATLVWHRTWIQELAAKADRLVQTVHETRKTEAVAKRVWYDARRKRRVIEKMRERAWERFRHEEARQERLELDEFARLRFVLPDPWRDDP